MKEAQANIYIVFAPEEKKLPPHEKSVTEQVIAGIFAIFQWLISPYPEKQ